MRRRFKDNMKSISSNIKNKLKSGNVEKLDNVLRFVSSSYCLVTTDYQEYADRKPPTKSKIYIQWACDLALWVYLIAILSLLIKIENQDQTKLDPNVFITFGIPLAFLDSNSLRIFMVSLGILVLFGAASRLIVIIREGKYQMEVVNIGLITKDPKVKGKLNSKYYSRACLIIEMFGGLVIKFFYFLQLFTFACSCLLVVYSKITPGVLFSNTMIIGAVLVFPVISWLLITVFYAGFMAFFLTTTYLKYRFKQVNEKIKDCKTLSNLMLLIREHNEICGINERNNKLMSFVLFQVYYFGSVVVDLSMIQSFYMKNELVVKIFFSLVAVCFTCSVFLLAYASASLSSAAHGSYNHLNSIIAKTSLFVPSRWSLTHIPIGSKLKILDLIERLAQTEITVWCLHLFPLNNFELYLFVASVATNFFLFLDLFKI